MTLFAATAFAQDSDGEEYDAAEKARRAHDMAASDVIYQQEDFRALYYQNQQMIAVLKEMNETLRIMREEAARREK